MDSHDGILLTEQEEGDLARIRLFYRIPKAPARGRALELTVDGNSIFRGGNWTGELDIFDVTAADPPRSLPFAAGDFDVVILHRTLDGLAALAREEGTPFVIHDFLSQIAGILTRGGLVIGCVENRHSLDRIQKAVKRLAGRDSSSSAGKGDARPWSVTACRDALAAAGFSNVRLFSMHSGLDSPCKLLSLEESWSRRACKRQVEAMRPLIGPSGYLVWRLLAELGVSQYLGAMTFFWGRKEC